MLLTKSFSQGWSVLLADSSQQRGQEWVAERVQQGNADAEQQLAKAREELRGQVADLAVKGAEQILKREVTASAHADLLARLAVEL